MLNDRFSFVASYGEGVQGVEFDTLEIRNWRQFSKVKLNLSARVTVLTGENGTGKSTLLAVLGQHFDWDSQFVSTPVHKRGEQIRYFSGNPDDSGSSLSVIGELRYSDGTAEPIEVPEYGAPEFGISFRGRKRMSGVYLHSHRNVSRYQKVDNIPARFSTSGQIMTEFQHEMRNRIIGQSNMNRTPMLVMKESLLAAAIYGEGNSSVSSDPEAAAIWTGFQRALESVFPPSFDFRKLHADPPEVIVEAGSGRIALEALSGGLSAIFELTWQIFLRSRDDGPFTVCIDEPENHLHPSLQQSLIPALLRTFPQAKFVVSTHSPFVVTSVENATVYALRRDPGGRVVAERLDYDDQPMPSDDVLKEVLGLGTTFPLWAEDRYRSILNRHANAGANANDLQALRRDLVEAGFISRLPEAIEDFLGRLGIEQP